MSIDKSLVVKDKLKRSRNVLKREERIARLKELEKWEEGRSVFSLPKVAVIKTKRVKTKAAKEEEKPAEGAAAAAPEAKTEK
jgi:small basic protein (TIGR04137 family)